MLNHGLKLENPNADCSELVQTSVHFYKDGIDYSEKTESDFDVSFNIIYSID